MLLAFSIKCIAEPRIVIFKLQYLLSSRNKSEWTEHHYNTPALEMVLFIFYEEW